MRRAMPTAAPAAAAAWRARTAAFAVPAAAQEPPSDTGEMPRQGNSTVDAVGQGGQDSSAVQATQKLVDTVNEFNANVSETQARLLRLRAMLSRFDDKRAESNSAEAAATWAARSRKARLVEKPCHFLDILNTDAIRRLLHFVDGKSLFACVSTCRALVQAQEDAGLWATKAMAETGDEAHYFDSAREAKRMYRNLASDWYSIVETFKWLARMGHPSDISGTRNGIPLHVRVLDSIRVALRLTSRQLLPPARTRQLADASLVSLFALMQSANATQQELATALAANLMKRDEYGRSVLVRQGALQHMKVLLKSHCIGLKKQASRLLVNALIPPQHRVMQPCYAQMMFEPHRGLSEGSGVAPSLPLSPGGTAGASAEQQGQESFEWVCVEFSPNGEPGPEHRLLFSTDESGSLVASGVDELGPYSLRQATLNRALQWAHGPSLDDDQVRHQVRTQRLHAAALAAQREAPAASDSAEDLHPQMYADLVPRQDEAGMPQRWSSAVMAPTSRQMLHSHPSVPLEPRGIDGALSPGDLTRLGAVPPGAEHAGPRLSAPAAPPAPGSLPLSPDLAHDRTPSEASEAATEQSLAGVAGTAAHDLAEDDSSVAANGSAASSGRLWGGAGAGVRGSLCKTRVGAGEATVHFAAASAVAACKICVHCDSLL